MIKSWVEIVANSQMFPADLVLSDSHNFETVARGQTFEGSGPQTDMHQNHLNGWLKCNLLGSNQGF